MLISWIQKTTLLDFPGKVACIIFIAGCNLRCSYCHNSEFVLPEKIREIKDFIPEEIFFNFLKTKIWLLDGVVICWGEPTLQKDLESFCQRIKDLGFLVKLDTNGQNPEILQRLIDKKLLDYIAMDIKWDYENIEDLLWVWKWKSKFSEARTVWAESEFHSEQNLDFYFHKKPYLESIEIIKSSPVDYEFRTTLIKNYHSLEDFENVMKQISWAKKYFLQNYKWWNTLIKNFDGESFLEKELIDFKNIAVKYVEKCIIRI